MEITCPRCRTRHHVEAPSSTRARTRPLRFRCSECGNTFPLMNEATAALPPALLPIEPPARNQPELRPVAPGEAVEMLRVGGDVYSVPDLATLQRWILEGRVGLADKVSQHGMRWTALADRPDLALFFAAAHAISAPRASPTILPLPSPVPPLMGSLPMAEDEEIYVQEVAPGEPGAPDTAFVGTPPELEEGPAPVPDVAESAEFYLSNPSISLAAVGRDDDPTIAEVDGAGPVDELPAEMLVPPRHVRATDDPDTLLEMPLRPPFRMEARSLGFQMGPDPDTQEASIEETQQIDVELPPPEPLIPVPPLPRADLADDFMLTGILPSSSPTLTPPPIDFGSGRTPITVAPRSPPSVLDEEPDYAPAPPRSWGPEWFIGGALGLAALLALGSWMFGAGKAPKGPDVGAPATEAVAPVAAAPEAAVVEPEAGVPPVEAAPVEAAQLEAEIAADNAQPGPDAAAQAAIDATVKADMAKAQAAARAEADAAAKDAAARAKAEADAAAKAKAAALAKAESPKPKPAVAPPAAPKAAASGGSAKSLADQGWKAMDKGDTEGAHGLFARALQKDPSSAWALYGRGYANEKLGDKVSAKADYCSATANAGSDTELSRELAGGLRRVGGGC